MRTIPKRAQTILKQGHRQDHASTTNVTKHFPPLTSGSDYCFFSMTTLTQFPSSHLRDTESQTSPSYLQRPVQN